MIDITGIEYDFVVIPPNLERLHVFNLAHDLGWEENEEEFAVRLTATFQNQDTPHGWVNSFFGNGTWVLLSANWGDGWNEVFRGRVTRNVTSAATMSIISIDAYDPLRELLMSEDDRFYETGTTAKFIFEDIFTSWGLPATVEGSNTIVVRGDLDAPDTGLAQQQFRGTRLGEMLSSVLDQVRLKGDGKFIMQSDIGRINVIPRGKNKTIYYFGQDNVTSVEDDRSIEDIVTVVRILSTSDSADKAQLEDSVLGHTELGTFQRVIYSDKFETMTAARAAAERTMNEDGKEKKIRRLKSVDLPFLRRGHAVHIKAGTLDGYYFVTGVQHNAKSRTMEFSVEDLVEEVVVKPTVPVAGDPVVIKPVLHQ